MSSVINAETDLAKQTYGPIVGNRWIQLAAGVGGGSALTLIPISGSIATMGWAGAMTGWGIGQGVVAVVMAMILHHPPKGWLPKDWVQPKAVLQTRKEFSAVQMMSSKEFYIMYAMFLMVCTGGLMTTGNMSQIAKSLNVFDAKFMGIAIVPFVATLAGVTNALARIMWGSVSDRFGREYSMAFAFALEGVLIFLMTQIAGNPIAKAKAIVNSRPNRSETEPHMILA